MVYNPNAIMVKIWLDVLHEFGDRKAEKGDFGCVLILMLNSCVHLTFNAWLQT